MRLSFNEACTKGCSTLEQDLDLCERVGFDYIEIRFDMLSEYLKTHTLAELRTYFDTHRLKPHALNAIYLYDTFLKPGDNKERSEQLIEKFLFGCMAAKEIGSPAIIVVPPMHAPDQTLKPWDADEVFADCSHMLAVLSRLAMPYGIKLCFELVGFPRSSVRTVAMAKRIVESVPLPNVGYVMDSYNLHLYHKKNDFCDLLMIDPDKLWAVHINNGDAVPEEEMGQDKRRFPDQGEVDLADFIRKIKELGYNGMVSVETFRPEYWARTPEWVIEEAFRTTKDFLKQHDCLS